MADTSTGDPIQVMIVDDSAVIRGLITRMLEDDDEISVTASVGNGQIAVNTLKRQSVDVIILDIEMPVMDGMTALPLLLEVDPDVKIIIASTLTKKNADISLRALQTGATDYVPKPTSSREIGGGSDFKHEILGKVKSLGALRRRRTGRAPVQARPGAVPAPRPAATGGAASSAPAAKSSGWHKASSTFELRKPSMSKPDVIAVGSSTGGPQALFEFFKGLPKDLGLPVVLTQHMPATFTTILAEHITRMSGWECEEAADGDVLEPNKILLAPGDYHMTIVQKGAQRVVKLNQNEPENFCRPAVDPMLRSLVDIYGGRILTVILTGMGNDGEKASQGVITAGGTVIAQDEATSVVWGMPGAVASSGLCAAVLPIKELGPHVGNFVRRSR